MIRRINAFRKIFNLLLSVVELLIGMHFLIRIFLDGGDPASEFVYFIRDILYGMGDFASEPLVGVEMERPFAALALVLGFMIFSFILIVFVPGMAARREKDWDE